MCHIITAYMVRNYVRQKFVEQYNTIQYKNDFYSAVIQGAEALVKQMSLQMFLNIVRLAALTGERSTRSAPR